MKIQGSGPSQRTEKSKKVSGKQSASDGDFSDMVAGGAKESGQVTTTQSIAKVDALLALQGAEDPAVKAKRARMQRRSKNILDELDRVRMAMLSGQVTVGNMINIADVVASHREKIDDPLLTNIMDEIDLRAQVELAKMRVVLDAQDKNR